MFLFVLNFGISWFNAWSVGRSWAETRAVGGFPRLMAWCGAIMSASGFTWCYLIVLALAAQQFEWLDAEHIQGMLSLGYLVIILPVLGSGLGITVQSWAHFARRRDLMSGGIAGYNTFAQAYNTYQAVKGIPTAFSNVLNIFDSDSSDDSGKSAAGKLVILLVVLAVMAGTLTTTMIIRTTARSAARDAQLDAMRSGVMS